MKSLTKKVREFVRNEEGQGLVEYALIIALIGILLVVSLGILRSYIGNSYNNAGQHLD